MDQRFLVNAQHVGHIWTKTQHSSTSAVCDLQRNSFGHDPKLCLPQNYDLYIHPEKHGSFTAKKQLDVS